MQVDRRVDVDGVDVRILDKLLKLLLPFCHIILFADFVQLVRGTLAQRVHVGVRMPLVDRDELLTKSEANNGNI